MKVHMVEQGSGDWLALRLGVPTASEFKRIVTPTGKFSTQSRSYAIRLVTERLLNRSLDDVSNLEWVARGKELEPEAARMFEFQNDAKTVQIGFMTTDDGRIGASPDRLVDDDGLLEIKCPAPQTHMSYLLDGFEKDYWPQVQGQMLVAEREWCARFSYHPDMPPVTERIERDEPYIKKLQDALNEFLDHLDEMTERAKSLGVIQAAPHIITPAEAAYGDEAPSRFLHTILSAEEIDLNGSTMWSG